MTCPFYRIQRKKHPALCSAWNPLQNYGAAVAGGVSTIFDPSTAIFSAVDIPIDAANGVSDKYKNIITLFAQTQEATARINLYLGVARAKLLRDFIMDFVFTILQVMGLANKAVRQGRALKYLKIVGRGKNNTL